jgi:hypothetical protein
MDVSLTLAHLRDPLDWRSETMAPGTTLLRSAPAASRQFARVALAVEHHLGRGRTVGARYRWIVDSRAGDRRRALHFLPVHALEARIEGSGARWHWGLQAHARADRSESTGAAGLTATIDFAARAGLALRGTEVWLMVENLFDAAARDDPYAPVTRRWVGLEWNLLDRARVP